MIIPPKMQAAVATMLFAAGIFVGRSSNRNVAPPAAAPTAVSLGGQFQTVGLTTTHRPAPVATPAQAQPDLVERFARVLMVDPPEEQQLQFLQLLKKMTAADAPAVLDLLRREQKAGIFSEPEWLAFWPRWGALDGPAALAYNLSLPDSRWNGNDISLTMRGWAAVDPDAAATWINANPDARHLDSAFYGYVDGLASKDLNGATAMAIEALPKGDPFMSGATERLADQAVRQGKIAGLEWWFDQLPPDADPGSAKSAAVEHVWWRLQKSDLEATAQWVAAHSGDPWRSDRGISDVAERVGADNPTGAVQWLALVGVSPNDGNYPGLNSVVRNWAQHDPAGLENWLAQPQGGAIQQQALSAYQAYRSGGK